MASYTAAIAGRDDRVAARRWVHEKATKKTRMDTHTTMAREVVKLANLYTDASFSQKQRAMGMCLDRLQAQDMDESDRIEVKAEVLEISHRESWQELVGEVAKGSKGAAQAILRCAAHELGFGPDHLASSLVSVLGHGEVEAWLPGARKEFLSSGNLPTAAAVGSRDKLRELQDAKPWGFVDSICYMQCRTCFGDDVMEQFAEQHAGRGCNILLLGSGYDTRFYRLNLPPSAQLFELDSMNAIESKLKAIRAADAEFPRKSEVRHIGTSFLTDAWLKDACSQGMDKMLPTLLVLEGLIYHLPFRVAERLLTHAAETFEGPAAIAFDYFGEQFVGEKTRAASQGGEPWLLSIESDDLSEWLQAKGLKELDHLSMQECAERYMPRSRDGECLGVGSSQKFFILAGNQHWTVPE